MVKVDLLFIERQGFNSVEKQSATLSSTSLIFKRIWNKDEGGHNINELVISLILLW